MVLFGEVLSGPEAETAGLVWRCVDDADLLDAAHELAARAAAAPRELTRRTKATMDDVLAIDDHEAAVARELETQLWSMDQPDFAERLAALQAKITSELSGPAQPTHSLRRSSRRSAHSSVVMA